MIPVYLYLINLKTRENVQVFIEVCKLTEMTLKNNHFLRDNFFNEDSLKVFKIKYLYYPKLVMQGHNCINIKK